MTINGSLSKFNWDILTRSNPRLLLACSFFAVDPGSTRFLYLVNDISYSRIAISLFQTQPVTYLDGHLQDIRKLVRLKRDLKIFFKKSNIKFKIIHK